MKFKREMRIIVSRDRKTDKRIKTKFYDRAAKFKILFVGGKRNFDCLAHCRKQEIVVSHIN